MFDWLKGVLFPRGGFRGRPAILNLFGKLLPKKKGDK